MQMMIADEFFLLFIPFLAENFHAFIFSITLTGLIVTIIIMIIYCNHGSDLLIISSRCEVLRSKMISEPFDGAGSNPLLCLLKL